MGRWNPSISPSPSDGCRRQWQASCQRPRGGAVGRGRVLGGRWRREGSFPAEAGKGSYRPLSNPRQPRHWRAGRLVRDCRVLRLGDDGCEAVGGGGNVRSRRKPERGRCPLSTPGGTDSEPQRHEGRAAPRNGNGGGNRRWTRQTEGGQARLASAEATEATKQHRSGGGEAAHRRGGGALAKTSAPCRRRLRRLHRLETCATGKGKRPAGISVPALQRTATAGAHAETCAPYLR